MKSYKHDDNTTRIAILETTIGHIHETLERIEKNMDKGFSEVSAKFGEVNKIIDNIESKMEKGFFETNKRIDGINNQLWSNFKWLLGIMLAGFSSVLGIVAHALHWF